MTIAQAYGQAAKMIADPGLNVRVDGPGAVVFQVGRIEQVPGVGSALVILGEGRSWTGALRRAATRGPLERLGVEANG